MSCSHSPSPGQRIVAGFLALTQFFWLPQPVRGADFYWDADGNNAGNSVNGTGLGGSGAWDTSSALWWNLTSNGLWPNTDSSHAIFTGPLGVLTPSTVMIDGAGVIANKLSFERNYTLAGGSLTLAGVAPTLHTTFAQSVEMAQQIRGVDGLNKTGGGTVRLLNPANDYTGTTTISNGFLSIAYAEALGLDSSPILINGSGNRGGGGGGLILEGTYTSGVNLYRDIVLQSQGPVPATGAAILSVGNNTLNGTLTNGTGAVIAGINSAGGTLTLNNVSLAGVAGTAFLNVGAGGGLVSVPGVGGYVINGTLSGTGSIQKSGGGTLLMPSQADDFAGTFRIYSGSMRFESLSAFGSNSGSGILSTLDLAGDSGTIEIRMDSANIGKNIYNRGGGSSIMFIDHALGSDVLNGTATFGIFNFDDGENTTFNGRNGYGATLGATTVNTGDGNTTFTNNMGGALTFAGDFWNNANNTAARTMTIAGTGNSIIEGDIIASAAAFDHILTKSGTGTLTITSTGATLDGAVNITAGTLAVTDFRSIGNNPSAINFGSTTTSAIFTIGTSTLPTQAGLTTNRVINLAGTSGGATINASQPGSLPAVLNGNFTATGLGSKTLTLSGTNTANNIFGAVIADAASDTVAANAAFSSGATTVTLGSVEGVSVGAAISGIGLANGTTITAINTATRVVTLSTPATGAGTAGQTMTVTGVKNLTSLAKSGPGTWVLTAANTFSGSTQILNGTLAVQDTFSGSSRNVLPDAGAVGFYGDAVTSGAAGGTLHYIGAADSNSSEQIGSLGVLAGAGTVRVTAAPGGTANLSVASVDFAITKQASAASSASTTVTVPSTAGLAVGMRLGGGSAAATIVSITNATAVVMSAAQTISAGTVLTFSGPSSVNFDPDAGSTVTVGAVPAAGFLSSQSYFKGADFAFAPAGTNAVLRAPVYNVDVGFESIAGGVNAISSTAHYEITGPVTSQVQQTINSLKISGSNSIDLTGLLTIRTGDVGTSGGILVTGGFATISGTGVTTGGAGDLTIRVDGASDYLQLNAPITATTTGGLVKAGAGTLIIGGVNAQTTAGTTHLLEGTIQMAPGGRLSANSVNFIMRQGTTFDLNGVSVTTGGTTSSVGVFSGAGTITNTSANPATFATAGTGGIFNGSINEVNGKISVIKMGTSASQTFNGVSNYTGSTTIGVPGNGTTGSLTVSTLANIGVDSSIGRGDATDTASNAASLIMGGTTGGLTYAGTTSVSTDRLFTLAGTVGGAGGTITNNAVNNQALVFSNTNPIAFSGNAAQTLQLGGSSTSDNWFYPQILDNGANPTRLNKIGAGMWILGNISNGYTGPTTIGNGILRLNDNSALPSLSPLVLGITSTSGTLEATGDFTRPVAATAVAGASTITWGGTTGGGGFSAGNSKLTVSLGGLNSPTELTWAQGGFVGTADAAQPLILNSVTALSEVEFRNPINLNGANRTITVNENTSTYTDFATMSGVLSNGAATAAGINKTGTGTLQLLGANTYNGNTAVQAGLLIVNSLGNSAVPGVGTSVGISTGANTTAQAITLGNGSTTPGHLQYIGPGEISDRLIRLNSTTGTIQLHADGTGPLILTNVQNNMAAGAKQLQLRGANTQGNMITSVLANNAAANALSITVDQAAAWILSGDNTYTGNTTVSAGALGAGHDNAFGTGTLLPRNGSLFAYGGDRTIANAVTVGSTTSAGTFTFIGDHSMTMAGLWTYTNTTAGHTITNGITPGKTLTLNGNMQLNALTGAVTLTFNGLGTTVMNGNIVTTSGQNVNISYSGNGMLQFTGQNPTAGNTTLNNNNGVLRISGAGKLGSGILTVNAGEMYLESVNHTFTSLAMGNVTNTSALLDIGAGVTLTTSTISFAGTGTLPSTITGAGTLHLGTGGVTVTVADNVAQSSDMFWKVANLTGSGLFTKAGNGTLDVTGITNNNFTGAYQISAGAILGLGAFNNNIILNGGVYQGKGTFNRALGTGDNQVQWGALGGGFAAVGGNLTVNIGGDGQTLVWNSTPQFLPDAAPLMFGFNTATDVVDFVNPINLGGAVRTVSVVDNTAVTTDRAVLSGLISNGGLNKTGNGILQLTGANTFTGGITVTAGTLQFSTVSNNDGIGASNLGQGSNGIALAGGRLQFIGTTPQSTDREITLTTTSSLDASGTAPITFNGTIFPADNPLNLEGSGEGVLNATMSHTGAAGDINKSGTGTWTITKAVTVGDNVVVNSGTLVLSAVEVFGTGSGDDIFIRSGTIKIGVDGALSNAMDDLNISSETSGGGILDLNGKTSSTADLIIGLNPANQQTSPTIAAPLSGSLVDNVGGGLFSTTAIVLRNGVISGNVEATGAVTVGNTISGDNGGIYTTSGTISGALGLNTGSSLVLYSGLISGNINFASGITLTKHSSNTFVISGNNTIAAAGLSTINNGVLQLDYSTNTGAKINSGGLTMNGGTLQLLGHASTPITTAVGNLTLGTTSDPAPAVLKIDTAGASVTLETGTITRAAGATLRVNPSSADGHVTTTATNTAGTILGGWATYQLGTGAAQFATVSGGEIVGFSSTVANDVSAWAPGADVTDSTGFTGATAADSSVSINSLRFNAAAGGTVNVGANGWLTIGSGGILITNNVTSDLGISGGRLAAGAGNEIIVTHDGSAPFTLNSRLGVTLALTKAGTGTMVLNNTGNNSLGTVRLLGGTLRLQGGGAIGDRAAVILEPAVGVKLDVVDSETIGSLSGGSSTNYLNMDVTIAGGAALTVNQLAAGTLYSDITATSGSATFNKNGTATLTITDGLINLGPNGILNVNTGRLTLDINGDNRYLQSVAAGTTINVGAGASLFIEHNGITNASGAVLGGRIADTVPINMNSTGSTSDGLYYRNDQNVALTEVVGKVTFGSGVNSVRVDATTTATNTTANTILRATSVVRTNQATLVLRGNGIQATANPRAQFQSAGLFLGFGTGTGISQPIIPWAIAPAAGGAVAADSFVTTSGVANAGWRPLNLATEYAIVANPDAWTATASSQNVLVNTSTAVNTLGSKTIRSLLISTGTGTVDLTGNGTGSLQVDSGGFLFSGTGSTTISGFTGINVNPTVNEYVFHVMGSGATIASPLIRSGAKLTKSGPGTLYLTANNAGLSDVALNEGILEIDVMDNIGATGNLLFAGGTLRLGPSYFGDDISTRSISLLLGGGTIDTNGHDLTLANSIGNGGAGGLTKTGIGTLTLNAPSSYQGRTTITAGSIVYGAAGALPSTDLALNGGSLDHSAFDATFGGLTFAANSTLNGLGNLTFTGNVEMEGGSRTLTLNSASTTFSGGWFSLVNTGTTARTLTINGSSDILISSEIINGTAAGSLTYSGSGTLTLTGANTYTGTTTLNNNLGAIKFSGAARLSGTALVVQAGSTYLNPTLDNTISSLSMGGGAAGSSSYLEIGAGKKLTLTGNVTYSASNNPLAAIINGAGPGAILDFGGAARTFNIGDSTNAEPDMLIGANVTLANDGGFGLIKTGTGTLHIAGTNSLTGPIVIQAGAVTGNLGTGNLSLNNGVFEGNGLFNRSLGTGNGQVQWVAGASGGFAASDGPLTVTMAGAGELIWDGTQYFVSGAGGLLFGSTTATDVVTFTHNLDLNAGAAPITRTVTVTDNADVLTDKATLSGALRTSGAGVTTLAKAGTGTLELAGLNTFTGPIIVSAGTLEFSTVSDDGGPASNLGRGIDGISLGASTTLSFIGNVSQSTNRAIQTTGSTTLAANGTNGATITYKDSITQAANNVLTLSGSGAGFITGGIIQPAGAASADLIVTSGDWTISTGGVTLADDLLVNGGTLTLQDMVLTVNDDIAATAGTINLNTTGIWKPTNPAGTSSGLFARNGGVVNINADHINGLNNANQVEYLLMSDSAGLPSTINLNNHVMTVPRVDLGGILGAGYEGNLLGTGTLTVTTSMNLYNGTVLANLAGAGTMLKASFSEVLLKGDNTGATGPTTLTNGTLRLDYTSSNTRKVASGVLTANGGTLIIDGSNTAATTESIASLTVNGSASGGASTISVNNGTGQSATLNLGAITRTAIGGTVNFGLSSPNAFITTTTSNPAGMTSLGGWAIVNDTAFATVVGSNIVAVQATAKDNTATWQAGDNVTDLSGYTGTEVASRVNSITFASASGSNLSLSSADRLVIASGGILISPNAGSGSITGGALASGLPVGASTLLTELVVHQGSVNDFTIGSRMNGFLGLTKSGVGTLVLNGTNTYSGQTSINEGILSIFGGEAIGDRSLVYLKNHPSAVLDLNNGTETISGLVGGGVEGGTVKIGSGQLTLLNTAGNVFLGFLSGNGTLIKSGTAAQELEGNNTQFTGNVIINGGLLHLDSTNGRLNAASGFVLNGAVELLSDQDQSSSSDRIGTVPILLNNTAGARGLWLRNENQDGSRTDGVGVVTLGAGHNVIQATTNAGTNTARIGTLTMSSLVREGHSTLLVRGQSLGAGGTIARGRIAPAVVPAGAAGGAGAAGTTTISIIPYIIGQTVVSAATTGTDTVVAGLNGNSFVTYVNATEGLRPLNIDTEYVLNQTGYEALAAVTASNVRFAVNPASGLVGGSRTINSLVLDSSNAALTVSGSAGDTLTLASGALLATTATPANGIVLDGFGSIETASSEYLFFVTNPTQTLTLGSALKSAAVLVKSGAGTLELTNAGNLFTELHLNQGAVAINGYDKLGSGPINFAGGILRTLTGFSENLGGRTMNVLTGGGTIDTGALNLTATNWVLTGSGNFAKVGTGSLTIGDSTTISHTGLFTQAQGTLVLQNTLGNSIGMGGLLISGTSNPNTVRLGASNQIADGARVEIRTNGSNAQILDLNNFNETIGNLVMTSTSSAGIAVKTGANGVLTLNGDLIMNNDRSADASTNEFQVLITGTGTTSTRTTTGVLDLGGVNRRITVESIQTTTTFRNDALIETVIRNGGIIKDGTRALHLRAANTYSGSTQIDNGAIVISAANNLGDGSVTNTIGLAHGGVLRNTGANVDLGVNRAITLGGTGGGLEVTGTNRLTVSGVISGNASSALTKSGPGLVILSAANAYLGATNVNEGILQAGINGVGKTGTGAITVANGATLTGVGSSIAGAVTLSSGGYLQAGDVTTVGAIAAATVTTKNTLTLTQSVTAKSGSVIRVDITGATNAGSIDPFFGGNEVGSAGYLSYIIAAADGVGDHDRIVFDNGSLFNPTLEAGAEIIVNPVSFTGERGMVFNLFDWAGVAGFDVGLNYRTGAADGGAFNDLDLPELSGGLGWDVSLFNSHGIVAIIPEPSRMLLLFLALFGLAFRRRRSNIAQD